MKKKAKAGNGQPPKIDAAPHGGIDSVSIDDLEKPAEKPERLEEGKPAGEQAAPEKPKATDKKLPPKKRKLSDQDKSKALGIAATVICAGGLAVFVLYQMFAGLPAGSPGNAPADPTGAPSQSGTASVPGETGGTEQLEFEPPDEQGQPQGSVYNRGQWDDYKLADEDGNQAASGPDAPLEGGTRYWVRDREGNNVFKIIIPAGLVAGDLGDCITVSTGDYAATGSEPLTFFWRNDTETRLLLERGYCDLARNATGYDQYDVRALGYYLFRDEDGQDWPVVTAVMTRDETNPDIDPYSEYRIVVGKPAADGRWLTGAIPAESFQDISSQLYPNISALAMGLFPAQSVPDFPDEWDIPPLGGTSEPARDEAPAKSQVVPDAAGGGDGDGDGDNIG